MRYLYLFIVISLTLQPVVCTQILKEGNTHSIVTLAERNNGRIAKRQTSASYMLPEEGGIPFTYLLQPGFYEPRLISEYPYYSDDEQILADEFFKFAPISAEKDARRQRLKGGRMAGKSQISKAASKVQSTSLQDFTENSLPRTSKRIKPIVKYWHSRTDVHMRYALTWVTSFLDNPSGDTAEISITMGIPSRGFVSGFQMENSGTFYRGKIMEKSEAKELYEKAASEGQTVGRVEQDATDTNVFTVVITVEPEGNVTFNLTYEEILERRNGFYEYGMNINPGMRVNDLKISVAIKDAEEIILIEVPGIKPTFGRVSNYDPAGSGIAEIKHVPGENVAFVTITLSGSKQDELWRAHKLEEGNFGVLVITYDCMRPAESQILTRVQPKRTLSIPRTPTPVAPREEQEDEEEEAPEGASRRRFFIVSSGRREEAERRRIRPVRMQGERHKDYLVRVALARNNSMSRGSYFVHFFRPFHKLSFPKHLIFVLDVSSSMGPTRMKLLKDVMMHIMDHFNGGDFFSVIKFSTYVVEWDYLFTEDISSERFSYPCQPATKQESPPPNVYEAANEEYVAKARQYISQLESEKDSNIHGGLLRALEMAKMMKTTGYGKPPGGKGPDPVIVLLSMGLPNTGEEIFPDKILQIVSEKNAALQVPIFSLAMSKDADFIFLNKLSTKNFASATLLHEGVDIDIQLRGFFREITFPILMDVTFKYDEGNVDFPSLSYTMFGSMYEGSEVAVARRFKSPQKPFLSGAIQAKSALGEVMYEIGPEVYSQEQSALGLPQLLSLNGGFVERMWAVINLDQLEEIVLTGGRKKSSTQMTQRKVPYDRGVAIAMQYSFVTPFTTFYVEVPEEITVEIQVVTQIRIGNKRKGFKTINQTNTQTLKKRGRTIALYQKPKQQFFTEPCIPSFKLDMGRQRKMLNLIGHPLLNIDVKDYPWYGQYVFGNEVRIPKPDRSLSRYKLGGKEVTPMEGRECLSLFNLPGRCTYLSQCSLKGFGESLYTYSRYFCDLNGFAGVCCPIAINEIRSAIQSRYCFDY